MSRFPLIRAYPFAEVNGLSEEAHKTKDMEVEWDLPYTSTVRRGYLIDLFDKKGILQSFIEAQWPDGATAAGKSEMSRCLRIKHRYEDFLRGVVDEGEIEEEVEEDSPSGEFAAEADLRDYLSRNLDVIEDGLKLYRDARGTGLEYAIEGGRIDILAIDRQQRPLVVELKLSRGRKKALGQLLYYMAWVDANLGLGQSRGLILAREIPEELKLAVQRATGVSLIKYRLSIQIERVEHQ